MDPSLFLERIKREFKRVDRSHYPVIQDYSDDELYDNGNWLSPGGYLLPHLIKEALKIEKGARILDLGCGNGQSSLFFAQRCHAQVVAVDLWVDIETRNERARNAGLEMQIQNLSMDLAHGLDTFLGTFDHIISVQAFHCFGTDSNLLADLGRFLKPNGTMAILQSTFSKRTELPEVFQRSNGWDTNYDTYYYPDWWAEHFQANGYQVMQCFELLDGKRIWEENILYFGKRRQWSMDYFKSHGWLMEQVLYHQDGLYLTHFLLTAKKGPI